MPPDTELVENEIFAEETPLEEIVTTEVEATTPEPVEEVVDYKALYEQRDREYQDFQESIRPIQEYQRAQEQAELERIEQSLLNELFPDNSGEQEGSSGGTPKFDTKQREAVQNLLRGGIQYYQQREMIQKNALAGEAISIAEEVLGSSATISQLKEVARELAALQDTRLMKMAVPTLKQKYRTGIAEQRINSGADAVQGAVAQPGILNDFKALERAFSDDKIPAGSAMEKRYFEMRAARGL